MFFNIVNYEKNFKKIFYRQFFFQINLRILDFKNLNYLMIIKADFTKSYKYFSYFYFIFRHS